ncbi:hypothetical protein STENM327S_07796 [Streptomyces tendae]
MSAWRASEFLGAGLQDGREQCFPGGEVPVQGAGTDARLLGHRLQGGADPVPQEVPLRGFKEGRAVALDVRARLTPLVSGGGHASSCLWCVHGRIKADAASVLVEE